MEPIEEVLRAVEGHRCWMEESRQAPREGVIIQSAAQAPIMLP